MKSPSKIEAKFHLYWRGCGGPSLIRELRFHEERRWRFDFAHLDSRTAFELQGGIWTMGRHSRGIGMVRDCEKSIAAALCGWLVVPMTERNITAKTIEDLVALTRDRERWVAPQLRVGESRQRELFAAMHAAAESGDQHE